MLARSFVAELVGTFLLLFVSVCVTAHLGQADQNLGLVGIALAEGLTVAALVSAISNFSIGCLNPAISLALLIRREINGATFLVYASAQVVGGILGALAARLCLPGMSGEILKAVTPALGRATLVPQGLAVEAILTTLLTLVALGTITDRKKSAGLCLGLAIVAGVLAIGPMTGAAMNPVRFLGPAVVSNSLDNWMVWIVGPCVGAVIGAMVFGFLAVRAPNP